MDTTAPETTWERFRHPENGRYWLWNNQTSEFFFEDCSEDWKLYREIANHEWYWHEVSGRWFFKPMK
jgi:hypothetical protein